MRSTDQPERGAESGVPRMQIDSTLAAANMSARNPLGALLSQMARHRFANFAGSIDRERIYV